MHTPVSTQTKTEHLDALRQRFQQASKPDKAKIPDWLAARDGCRRKHAIRLLRRPRGRAPRPAGGAADFRRGGARSPRRPVGAADRICGKRLKAILSRLL
jgi:hypothetical protein